MLGKFTFSAKAVVKSNAKKKKKKHHPAGKTVH